MTKLQPCPFCGSEKITAYSGQVITGAWVACLSCGLETPTETGITHEKAVEYWNARATAAAQPVAWRWKTVPGGDQWFVRDYAPDPELIEVHSVEPLYVSPPPTPAGDTGAAECTGKELYVDVWNYAINAAINAVTRDGYRGAASCLEDIKKAPMTLNHPDRFVSCEACATIPADTQAMREADVADLVSEAWEAKVEVNKLTKLLHDGIECSFDDNLVTIFISDESEPSIGLDGGLRLSLSCNYEVIPLSLLREIKNAMGDNWERCVDLWRQTYEPALADTGHRAGGKG